MHVSMQMQPRFTSRTQWLLRILNRESNRSTGKVISRNIDLESSCINFDIYRRLDKEMKLKINSQQLIIKL